MKCELLHIPSTSAAPFVSLSVFSFTTFFQHNFLTCPKGQPKAKWPFWTLPCILSPSTIQDLSHPFFSNPLFWTPLLFLSVLHCSLMFYLWGLTVHRQCLGVTNLTNTHAGPMIQNQNEQGYSYTKTHAHTHFRQIEWHRCHGKCTLENSRHTSKWNRVPQGASQCTVLSTLVSKGVCIQ